MYQVEFEAKENIFSPKYQYKIHCIGKCVKGNTPFDQTSIFYFVSHGKKYEIIEKLKTLEDISVTLREVENFSLPLDPKIDYAIFKKITNRSNIKYKMIKEYEDMTYQKDGFVIFKQMYIAENGILLGGIDDPFEYERATYNSLKERLDNCVYDKDE